MCIPAHAGDAVQPPPSGSTSRSRFAANRIGRFLPVRRAVLGSNLPRGASAKHFDQRSSVETRLKAWRKLGLRNAADMRLFVLPEVAKETIISVMNLAVVQLSCGRSLPNPEKWNR